MRTVGLTIENDAAAQASTGRHLETGASNNGTLLASNFGGQEDAPMLRQRSPV
ncbi:MAG: hypothetical protein KDC98_16485 [Planctomycetes bacterium]|nr:hypothetical protein [Planctomycetota bacterium]